LKFKNLLLVHSLKRYSFLLCVVLTIALLAGCSQAQAVSPLSSSQISQPIPTQPVPTQDAIIPEELSPDLASEVEGYASRKSNPSPTEGETLLKEPPLTLAEQPPVAPEIGATAPNFIMETLDGRQIQLSELNGRPVLINYWVTWCIPCMEELPALDRLSEEFPNLEILTVNGIDQDDLATINQKIAELHLDLPVLLDENKSFWQDFQVLFLPTSFFIDQYGVIRHIQLGSLSEADLRQKIGLLIDGNL
jgi:peroxiredoxin